MTNHKKLEGEFILHDGPEPKGPTDETQLPQQHEEPASKKELVSGTLQEKLAKNRHLHFFSSLVYKPEGLHFENQEVQERIVLIVRRDFITNLPWILTAIFLAILPIVITPFLPVLIPFVSFSETTRILYTLFYYLVLTGFVIVKFSLWYFHIGIVTNIKVIDVDVHGILSRDVASTLIADIEDVGYTQIGVIPSIFNYGNVNIQTAAEKRNFEFDRVPEPSIIVQVVQELMAKEREREYES